MLQDVEHGDCGATARREGRLRKVSAHRWNASTPPGRMGRVHREIETRHGTGALDRTALGEHLQEQAASAACIGDNSLGLGFAQGSLHKMQVIAQHKPAIPLLHAVDCSRFWDIPVVGRVILLELFRRGLGVQTNQAAGRALDDLKHSVGGAVEPVGGGKQFADFGVSAANANLFGGMVQLADSESSRRPIRFAISSWRICRPVNLRFSRRARRLRSVAGIRGKASAIPRRSARAAVSFPLIPG